MRRTQQFILSIFRSTICLKSDHLLVHLLVSFSQQRPAHPLVGITRGSRPLRRRRPDKLWGRTEMRARRCAHHRVDRRGGRQCKGWARRGESGPWAGGRWDGGYVVSTSLVRLLVVCRDGLSEDLVQSFRVERHGVVCSDWADGRGVGVQRWRTSLIAGSWSVALARAFA